MERRSIMEQEPKQENKIERKPLLIEIGHEEMPAMPETSEAGDLQDQQAQSEKSTQNNLAVRVFNHLNKIFKGSF